MQTKICCELDALNTIHKHCIDINKTGGPVCNCNGGSISILYFQQDKYLMIRYIFSKFIVHVNKHNQF